MNCIYDLTKNILFFLSASLLNSFTTQVADWLSPPVSESTKITDTGHIIVSHTLKYFGYDKHYLDFPYIKTRISPAKGMMMCFPIINKYGEQTPDFSHSASVITKGRKLMCYLTLNSSIKVSRMPDNS